MNEELNEFDEYFIKWWEENKKHFQYQIDEKMLCDEAVKTIASLDHFLKGFKWEMNQSLTAMLHGFFANPNRTKNSSSGESNGN